MSSPWQLRAPGPDGSDAAFPFTVGVIADFGGRDRPPLARRRFRELTLDDLDDFIAAIAPRLRLAVTDRLSGDVDEITLDLRFRRFADFDPAAVARQVEPLRYLMLAGRGGRGSPAEVVVSSDADLLSQMLGRSAAVATAAPPTDDLDAAVSRQLDEVVHHPEFERLESAWRGLRGLLARANGIVRVRVMDIGRDELVRDLARPGGWDKSDFARAVVDGVEADRPFDLFVCDGEFGPSAGDVAVLRGLAGLGSLLMTPVVTAAAAAMLGGRDFDVLLRPGEWAVAQAGVDFAAWRSLRESTDAAFLALTLPPTYARPPYAGLDLGNDNEFAYTESGSPPPASAAWVLAGRAAACADRDGWFDRLREPEDDLPAVVDTSGGRASRRYTPVEMPRSAAVCAAELGLSSFAPADAPVFAPVVAVQKPKRYHESTAQARANYATRLDRMIGPYRLARAAGVVAVKLLSRTSRVEDGLRAWLADSVGEGKPLRAAELKWEAVAGSPGEFDLTLTLTTHHADDPGVILTVPVSAAT